MRIGNSSRVPATTQFLRVDPYPSLRRFTGLYRNLTSSRSIATINSSSTGRLCGPRTYAGRLVGTRMPWTSTYPPIKLCGGKATRNIDPVVMAPQIERMVEVEILLPTVRDHGAREGGTQDEGHYQSLLHDRFVT
ncbi:hypothetical protein [Rhizobium grahamii]|uniref:hypothetical protein n=1 Tax=Rhizobium grahamii TaxID=1120045 RepID=UPI00167BB3DE|nr:hypothetical protein [Rhizobium grahamii]